MTATSSQPGDVITFYSYKGGTGRTMALANVACLLARSHGTAERPVLMMDWDFEAPGLHRFFASRLEAAAGFAEARGTLDLLLDISANHANSAPPPKATEEAADTFVASLDLGPYQWATTIPNLRLMKAGAGLDDETYADRVNSFDWERFYERFPWLFRALANRLGREFAFVLIDSRTGLTDSSGICSMLMPSKLVGVFTPGMQSLYGLSGMVRRAIRYRRQSSDPRPLGVFPLASRIENSEEKLKRAWRRGAPPSVPVGYQALFQDVFREGYGFESCDLTTYFDDVAIQHVPYFAYGESIAVEEQGTGERLSLSESYRGFTERLVELAGAWEDLANVRTSRRVEQSLKDVEERLARSDDMEPMEVVSLLEQAEADSQTIRPAQDFGVGRAWKALADVWAGRTDWAKQSQALGHALAIDEDLRGLDEATVLVPQRLALLTQLAEAERRAANLKPALTWATRARTLARRDGVDAELRADVEQLFGQIEVELNPGRRDVGSRAAGAPRHVRVFLTSPGDVQAERRIAREVLDALPRDPLLRGRCTIEAVSWDDPSAPTPMWAGLTPQQAVDMQLPSPADCDLTVAIFWGRMGTPLSSPLKPDGEPYLSGTEYELEAARAAGKPVLLYKCNAKIAATLDEEDLEEKRRQLRLVNEYFGRHRDMLFNQYENPDAFRTHFEAHIKVVLRKLLEAPEIPAEQRLLPGGGATTTVVPHAYREWLQSRCASVELLGLRRKQGHALRLSHVYVPLTTSAAKPEQDESWRERKRRGEVGLVPANEPDAQLLLHRVGESSVYISGDPGSGKSTFCRWLAWLTCEGAVPPPDVDSPKKYRETLPPSLAGRLALLIPLRAFWTYVEGAGRVRRVTRRDLEDAVASWLDSTGAPGMTPELVRAHTEAGSALLVFDGLDEVPHEPRLVLLNAIAEARDWWDARGNRVVVTSRPYGLSDADVRKLGLPPAPIRPLHEAMQWHLVQRWFALLHDTAADATASATNMMTQVKGQPWLSPLTQNPLLLTGMCIVFGDGKGLPEDKYELYDRVADAVLHNRLPDRVRRQGVRARLAVVAHGMHTGDGLGEERATPQAEVLDAEIDRMLRIYRAQSEWTEPDERSIREAREELMTETGLLLQRGEHHAAFLHLSFQEFLTAQRLADVEGDRLRDVFVQRSQAPEWRNTLSFLFGSVLFTSTTPERAVRLLTDLVGRLKGDDAGLTLVTAEAAEMLQRRGLRVAPAVAHALRKACEVAMRGNATPRNRAQAGTALGRIGDHRFRADRWFLPDDAMLGFVEIPAGAFTMGSDRQQDEEAHNLEMPQHRVSLPTYFIGKWPVTVAQFRAFVDDRGHNSGFVPGNQDCLSGIGNHPVVSVSWHEAAAYCRWLTMKLRDADDTPVELRNRLRGVGGEAWRVTLPSEAEWERAARGQDAWVCPWGRTADPNCANFYETGILATSAVGCFPLGRSPARVEEMSGNVLEWTRSPSSTYPFVPDYEGVEAVKEGSRVGRGAAFSDRRRSVRAARRSLFHPDLCSGDLGVRVVVSPFPADL